MGGHSIPAQGQEAGSSAIRAAQLYMETDEAKLCALARASPVNRRNPLNTVEEPAGAGRVDTQAKENRACGLACWTA